MRIQRFLLHSSSCFVQEKIEVRTSHENWWFNPENYTNKANADEKLLYNSTIPSPFKVLRNFYGGRCLAFSVPDFLWHEGIRRIGIFLQKPSFIRSLCIKRVADPRRRPEGSMPPPPMGGRSN